MADWALVGKSTLRMGTRDGELSWVRGQQYLAGFLTSGEQLGGLQSKSQRAVGAKGDRPRHRAGRENSSVRGGYQGL